MAVEDIIRKLTVMLDGQSKPFVDMMNDAESRTDRLAQQVGSKLRGALMAGSVALNAFGAGSLYAFANFDDAMTKSTAILSGVTAEIRKEMEDTAIALSLKTSTSADKLAESYYFLASAGLDAKQAIGALAVVNNFAIAGDMDMAKATEQLADAQATLGLKTADATQNMLNMTRVSDVLVEAGNAANASAEQFATALNNKAGAALRLLNKDIEEGTALLAAYANQGIKGEKAGEQLSIVLREAQVAAAKESEAWTALGISLYDAQGNMLPLVDFIEQLEKKMKGMSDQQRQATFEMLGFRSESMGAIAPLLGMSQSIRDFEKQLRNAGGATQTVTDRQMKSFSMQMAIAKNNINAVAIEVGAILAPSVIMLNGIMTKSLEIWRAQDDQVKVVVVTLGKVVAVLGPIIASWSMFNMMLPSFIQQVGQASKAVSILTWGFRALGLTALAPFLPIIGIVAAVGAAIAAIVYFVVGQEGLVNAWNWCSEAVSNFTSNAVGFLTNFATNIGILLAWLKENWFTLLVDVFRAWVTYQMNMANNTMVALQIVARLFVAFIGWLTIAIPEAWNRIFSWEMINAIVEGFKAAGTMIAAFAQRVWDTFKVAFQAVKVYFMETMRVIGELTMSFFAKLGTVIQQILKGNIPNPIEIMNEMMLEARQKLMNASAAAGVAIGRGLDVAAEKFKGVTDQIQADFNKGASNMNFFDTAGDIIGEGMDKMKRPLEGFESRLKDTPKFVTGEAKKIADTMEGAMAPVEGATDPIVEGMKETETQANSTAAAIGKLGDGIDGAFKGSTEAAIRADKFLAALTGNAAGASVVAKKKSEAEVTAAGAVAKGPNQAGSDSERAYTQRDTMIELLMRIEANTMAATQIFHPANL